MEWLEWNEDSFAQARLRRSPILLYLRASWCRWCRELEDEVFVDPRIAGLLAEHFVAIRVDKDRRPDIDARYSKGGWPTLAYLDDTGEMIASDPYLEADRLHARLELVSGYYADNRDTIRRRLAEAAEEAEALENGPRRSGEPWGAKEKGELVDWVARTLLETSDPKWGGWGQRHKFPHPEAIDFALARWTMTGDDALRQLVLRTLRNMQDGAIHDRVEGGFYRYATEPDWSAPHYEKVLDSNAQRLFAYLQAHQALGDESFRATAESIVRWMDATLLDPELGAYRGSQDAHPAYAHLPTVEARREFGPPECDPTIFTNWNAMAASALLRAAVALEDDALEHRALGVLEFLAKELYDPQSGFYHYWDGTYHLPGLLSDQAYALQALIDAHQFVGGERWLDLARDLARFSIDNLRSENGGFWDTRLDPGARGGLRRRNRSLLENAVMAEALLRLGHLARDREFDEIGRETLVSFQNDYKRYGHFVAGYGRAVDLELHPPVHVTIVGPAEREDTRRLRRAALKPYVPNRLVQVIDPEREPDLLERCGLEASEGPSKAYLQRGRESYGETVDPVRLAPLMTRIERGGDG